MKNKSRTGGILAAPFALLLSILLSLLLLTTATHAARPTKLIDDTGATVTLGDYAAITNAATASADSAQVETNTADIAAIEDTLELLLYVSPAITGFSITEGTTFEKGTTLNGINLTWSLNKIMTWQALNTVSIATNLEAYAVAGDVTTDTSHTLQASDGVETNSATARIYFRDSVYWGVSAETSLTSAEVLALGNSALATSKTKSITYDCSAEASFPYYAYPQSWGVPSGVKVNGLSFTDLSTITISHTNASGYATTYYVVRFNSLQNSASIIVNWN